MALKDLTPSQREAAISAYPATSTKSIAQQLGVSYHSIRELMHEAGLIKSKPVYKKRIIPTSDQRQAVFELYQSGSTTATLAEQFNFSIATVANILKERGINLTRKHLSQQQKDYIVKQYELGESSKKIAKTIGFSDMSVLKVIKDANVEIRPCKKTSPESEKHIVASYQSGESSESIAKRLNLGTTLILGVLSKNNVKMRGRILYERPAEPLFEPKFEPRQLPGYKHPGVYKFTNLINGKVYIGQAQDIYQRYYKHHEMKASGLFTKALKKYGIGNFDFEVIERVDDLSKLDEREQYWMDFYRAYDREFGYNICKVAGSPRGRKREAWEMAGIIAYNKGRIGPLNPNYGKKASPETRAKISAAAKERARKRKAAPNV